MGSKSSKPEEEMALTTSTVPLTFQTTTVSDYTKDCRSHVEIALAFFGGIFVAFLICALVFCVIKIKDKVKKQSGRSRSRNQEGEILNGIDVHCLETTDENVSYASVIFVKS